MHALSREDLENRRARHAGEHRARGEPPRMQGCWVCDVLEEARRGMPAPAKGRVEDVGFVTAAELADER